MILLAAAAAVLLAGAALSLTLPTNPARAWASIVAQAIASALALSDALPVLLGGGDLRRAIAWSYPVGRLAVHLDPLGAFFLAWSLPLTLLGTIYALGYLRPAFRTRRVGLHFALLDVVALSFLMVYTFESALAFLLGWEIAAVAAWLLVIWESRNERIRFAGFNYLVSTHVGFFVLVGAFMVMHSQTGSLDFQAFGAFLRTPGRLRDVTFVLLVVSFGLKAAFFPFHTWLPRAHSAAPAHVSALMSGVIHKAGLFGLLRLVLLVCAPEAWMGWSVLAFSAASAVVGVLSASTQRDLKRLLGYSSTENVGIAGMGIGVGLLGLSWHQPLLVALGFTGAMLHLVNHALFKCLLFYAAGALHHATHTVDLERLGGLARRLPWTAGLFLLGALAIAAVPPLNGFTGELLIYAGLLHPAAPPGIERALLVVAAAVLAFVGAVSALALARAFGVAFLGTPRDDGVHCEEEAGPAMRAPMLLHGAGIVLIGLVPAAGLALVRTPARLFGALLPPGAPGAPDPSLAPAALLEPVARVGLLLLAVLAALVAARRWLAGGVVAPRRAVWGCGYAAPTARMQLTATSFSAPLARIFYAVLAMVRRERPIAGPFPERVGHLDAQAVDPVERRIFEAIGEGDAMVRGLSDRLPAGPGIAIAAGLLALVLLAGIVAAGGGGQP